MRDPKEATTLCSFCPKLCRYSCPVADADPSETATPWGKMTAMKRVEENKLPMDNQTMGLAYKCLNCRAAQHACELDNPVDATLDTYRVRAFRAGLTPGGIEAYCEKFQKHNNPYGKDLYKALEGRFQDALKPTRTAYFPGCTEIAKNPDAIEKALALLGGISLYAEPIQCCGYPLFVAGDWEGFVELAEVNSHALRDYDRIVTGAPACLYTMETLYRSAGHGVGTRFKHVAEHLAAKLIPDGGDRGRAVSPPIGARIRLCRSERIIAYHDPCYLGRYRQTYNEPRELIRRKTGRPPKEFIRHREASACCGAGGLLPVSFPEIAARVTESRVAEFRKTGADLLVTGCPTCVNRFRKFGVPTQGLGEFLGARVAPSTGKAGRSLPLNARQRRAGSKKRSK